MKVAGSTPDPFLCRIRVRAECLRETERSGSLLELSIENKVEGEWFFKADTVIFRETALRRGCIHCRGESRFDPVLRRIVVPHDSTVGSK